MKVTIGFFNSECKIKYNEQYATPNRTKQLPRHEITYRTYFIFSWENEGIKANPIFLNEELSKNRERHKGNKQIANCLKAKIDYSKLSSETTNESSESVSDSESVSE